MPIYEFRCCECGTLFEALVRSNQDSTTCPSCGGRLLEKKVSAAALINVGNRRSGDKTCCGRDERCARPPCSEGQSCHRG